jgi:hypothetical protein
VTSPAATLQWVKSPPADLRGVAHHDVEVSRRAKLLQASTSGPAEAFEPDRMIEESSPPIGACLALRRRVRRHAGNYQHSEGTNVLY